MDFIPKFFVIAMSKSLLRQCVLLMLFMLGWVSTAQAAIPPSQAAVLTNLYASTNGASWTNNANWNGSPGTECTWNGVTCDGTQSNVVSIGLAGNNLVGTLPSISALTVLQTFDVGANQLTGSIPSLSGLTALQNFYAQGNRLSGSIPSLSGLTALRQFTVNANQLTGSIPSLSGLTALVDFNVRNNQLTGSIPPLSGLTALSTFRVQNNQLTGPVPAPPASLTIANLCTNSLVSSGDPTIDNAWTTVAGNWLACQTINAQTIGTISFTPTTLAAGGTTTASATATSALAVTFSSTTSNICTVSGNTVTGVAAGTCTIAADQAGNVSYSAAAQVTQSIQVTPPPLLGQSIGTISFSPSALTVGGTSTASAVASSGLAATFTSTTPNICTVSGSTVTAVAAGTCTIAADQAGSGTYSAAAEVTASIQVTVPILTQTIGTISFSPATLTVGGTSTVSATATSGLAVTFSSTTPGICFVSGSTVTGIAAGSCTIAANQAGNGSYSAATQVTQSVPVKSPSLLGQTIGTISFLPAALTVGGTTTVLASANSSYAVTFSSATPGVCAVSGSTVTGIAAGTCTVAANQAGDGTYSAALQVTQSIQVATPTCTPPQVLQNGACVTLNAQTIGAISFSPTTLVVGGTATVQATASSGLAVSFNSLTPSICAVSGSTVTANVSGTCTIIANQAGNTSYSPVSRTASISVGNPAATSYTLSAINSGSGSGTVASTDNSINCGSTCSATFRIGAYVTLAASPASGSTFAGWSGDCTGTSACMLAMNSAKNVTAIFVPVGFTLNINSSGASGVQIGSSPATYAGTTNYSMAGIARGTGITLIAPATSGNASFNRWSGCDTAQGLICTVTMNAAKSVTATYAITPYTLSVTSSDGSGTITSADGRINCGAICSASFNNGTSVTLTATSANNYLFDGWNGCDTSTNTGNSSGSCTVNIDSVRTVQPLFHYAAAVNAVTQGTNTDGTITAPVATVITQISYNPPDVGKTEQVFVTALVPASVLGTSAAKQSVTENVRPMSGVAPNSSVLVQLTQSGWQPVANGQLIPYVTGVLGDQISALTILNNTNTSGLGGTQLCVGYGTSASEMTAAGRMQLVAVIAGQNSKVTNSGSCNVTVPISETSLFAYAQATYASLFAGTASTGQFQQYDYRYYSSTQNFLAVDTSSVVYVYGPASGGQIQSVGPLEDFRSVITAWGGGQ